MSQLSLATAPATTILLTARPARGVVFDDYDLPGLKTVEHVCVLGAEKAAWFKDPNGNILCLHEPLNR